MRREYPQYRPSSSGCQYFFALPRIATPIATTLSSYLPHSLFARPAEVVAPGLIGCLLGKRQADGELLWGVIVETEAYSQEEPACHGYRRRTPSNEMLFGAPGRFYVVVSYGIHHCVNVVIGLADWANGPLVRGAWLSGEPESFAAGPALLAKEFCLSTCHDAIHGCGSKFGALAGSITAQKL